MLNLLTDIPGLQVGHATNLVLGSGVTVVLFDKAPVASCVISGGAPGTRDTTLLDPELPAQFADAFCLSGGSCFGLDAPGGVQAFLRSQGRGVTFGNVQVPLVPGAIIFDLTNGGNKDWGLYSPYRDMGYAACLAARPGPFELGTVGAGTGATTSTLKGGVGSASTVTPNGYIVAALAVVNAVGTANVGDGPHFWAAPFEQGNEFGGLGLPSTFSSDDLALRIKRAAAPTQETATTITVIATDAVLTKAQTKRLARMADDGLARALHPIHAINDGDTVLAAATCEKPLLEDASLTEIGHAAASVMARAVARGVYEATTLPYPPARPSWKSRFG